MIKMKKVLLTLGILCILIITGYSQELTNKEKFDIYDYQLRECISSKEYQEWKDVCYYPTYYDEFGNVNDSAQEKYYLENCFGKHYCEEKLRGLAEELDKANVKVIVVLINDKEEGKYSSTVMTLGLQNTYEAYGILDVAKRDLQEDE